MPFKRRPEGTTCQGDRVLSNRSLIPSYDSKDIDQ